MSSVYDKTIVALTAEDAVKARHALALVHTPLGFGCECSRGKFVVLHPHQDDVPRMPVGRVNGLNAFVVRDGQDVAALLWRE